MPMVSDEASGCSPLFRGRARGLSGPTAQPASRNGILWQRIENFLLKRRKYLAKVVA